MRTYTLTRTKKLNKGEHWNVETGKAVKLGKDEKPGKEHLDFIPGLTRIGVGNHEIEFDPKKDVYKGVPEEIALRAKKSGEFSIKLEE